VKSARAEWANGASQARGSPRGRLPRLYRSLRYWPCGEDGEAKRPGGTRRRCRAAFAAWPRCGGPRGRASPNGQARSQRHHSCQLTSLAVPLTCHSQRFWRVPSGQPRTTRQQPLAARFTIIAGGERPRSGFGSRGSPIRARSRRRTASDQDQRVPHRVITTNGLWTFLDRSWELAPLSRLDGRRDRRKGGP
jgi:hypothetical protein